MSQMKISVLKFRKAVKPLYDGNKKGSSGERS